MDIWTTFWLKKAKISVKLWQKKYFFGNIVINHGHFELKLGKNLYFHDIRKLRGTFKIAYFGQNFGQRMFMCVYYTHTHIYIYIYI